jgi:hypothetical protein
MRVATTLLRLLGLSAAALCASLVLRGDSRATPNLGRSAMLAGSAPATMLWAWEEPEDLRGSVSFLATMFTPILAARAF